MFVLVLGVVSVRVRVASAVWMGVLVGMLFVLVVVFVVFVAVGMLVRRAVGVLVRVGMLARCHVTLLLVKYSPPIYASPGDGTPRLWPESASL